MSKDALPPRRHGHKFAKTVAPLWNEAKLVARNATLFKKLLVLDQIFDRAQRAYDNQSAPEGDGLECPECGGTNGFYTQKERNGRFFIWNAECPDCHAQWGDDNLDSDRDER